MKPPGNGLVTLHDDKATERGFCCMKLIGFLFQNGVKDWDAWHNAHVAAADGRCLYQAECSIFKNSKKKNPKQLEMFI